MAKKKNESKKTATQPTQYPSLPNVLQLTKTTTHMLWSNKAVLGGIALIYGLLSIVLVQGLAATTDVVSVKQQLNQVFTGNLGSVASSFSVFMILVGSAGSGSSQSAGVYQFFLGLIASLAIIWALRQLYSNVTIRIRDAYYRGMTPLVPFVLVLLMVGLQLLPMLIGSSIYSTVISNGIAVTAIEKLLWLALFLGLTAVSLYFISSSVIALYIATLPDMTPLKALRSAKELVKNRRWLVIRKLLFLPVALLVAAAVIMLPVIAIIPIIAPWLFFVLTMMALVVIHTYIYTLYRELIRE